MVIGEDPGRRWNRFWGEEDKFLRSGELVIEKRGRLC